MAGPELSVLAVCDGAARRRPRPGPGLQAGRRRRRRPQHRRHGRLLAGAVGADDARRRRASTGSSSPTLAELRRRGIDYRGMLYAGLMLTADGPEAGRVQRAASATPRPRWCCPGCAPTWPSCCAAAAAGDLAPRRRRRSPTTPPSPWCCASEGYPRAPAHGRRHRRASTPPRPSTGVVVFCAGVGRRRDGALVTAGGRVLDVVGHRRRPSAAARHRAYAARRPHLAGPACTTGTTSHWRQRDMSTMKVAVLMGSPNDGDKMQPAPATRSSASASRPTCGCCRPTAHPPTVAEFAPGGPGRRLRRLHLRRRHGRPPGRGGGRPHHAAGGRRAAVGRRPQRRRRPLRHGADAQGHPRGHRRHRRRGQRRAARGADAGDHRRRPGGQARRAPGRRRPLSGRPARPAVRGQETLVIQSRRRRRPASAGRAAARGVGLALRSLRELAPLTPRDRLARARPLRTPAASTAHGRQ